MKIPGSEITPYKTYLNRRTFIKSSITTSLTISITNPLQALHSEKPNHYETKTSKEDKLNSFEDITNYNNFYEFGSHKKHPAQNSSNFNPNPWSIKLEGLVNKPKIIDLEKLLNKVSIEDRIYRLRCVEAWSMVIPWQGFPLSKLIKIAEPLSSAKFIQFVTIFRPSEMPGQQTKILDWPYIEGLRMDEAMHPLTILATGLYGHEMPNQNGAPIRLVVPWKYGFKSIKSIVAVRFLEEQPPTTWESMAPWEYGFYANVNPNVNHPRWSQGKERRIGELKRRKTLMFNGYEAEVSNLYKDLDLKKYY